LNLLVLGGTRFLGRAVVADALASGHRVSLFNRGLTNPGLFPEAEKLTGDRVSDLSALRKRSWDAVIDVAAHDPDAVARSLEVLGERVGRYVFVSTLSTYADHATTNAQREDAELLDLDRISEPSELYGARKAACERLVLEAFGARASVARAGLIVGPHDPTQRFVYWPRRMAVGGRVLAPGDPSDPLQFIDVRDLGRWLVLAAQGEWSGVQNVTGRPVAFGKFLEECRTPGIDAELAWVSSARLLEANVDPWMGVPLWIAAPGWEAANRVDVSRALAAGLRCRPLRPTIEASGTESGSEGASVLRPEDEARLLGLAE